MSAGDLPLAIVTQAEFEPSATIAEHLSRDHFVVATVLPTTDTQMGGYEGLTSSPNVDIYPVPYGVVDERSDTASELVKAVSDNFGVPDLVVLNKSHAALGSDADLVGRGLDAVDIARDMAMRMEVMAGFAGSMAQESGGLVLNISDLSAHIRIPGWTMHSTAMAGMERFTSTLSSNYAGRNLALASLVLGKVSDGEGSDHELGDAIMRLAEGDGQGARHSTTEIADMVGRLAELPASFINGRSVHATKGVVELQYQDDGQSVSFDYVAAPLAG